MSVLFSKFAIGLLQLILFSSKLISIGRLLLNLKLNSISCSRPIANFKVKTGQCANGMICYTHIVGFTLNSIFGPKAWECFKLVGGKLSKLSLFKRSHKVSQIYFAVHLK